MSDDNRNVLVSDAAIIFKKTKNKRVLVLNKGETPNVGDTIGIHPYDLTNDGNKEVTHGLNHFEVGEEVIVRKLKGGSEAAFKPGFKGMYGCRNIDYGGTAQHGEANEDGSRQYYAYTMHLNEPFYRRDHDLNLFFSFRVQTSTVGFQLWYPDGGVWLGFSGNGEDWNWCGGVSPYMVLSNPPQHDCSWSPGDIWCLPDALNLNECNSRPELGGNCYTTLGMSTEINYVHIHIRTCSSLFWNNHTFTDLSEFRVCRGLPTEVDPCPYFPKNQGC